MPPVHNAIKYGTDLLRAFPRALGLGEDEEGTVRLGETLTPVIDILSRPEWAFLRNEKLFSGFISQAAVVAEFGYVAVVNPTGSRMIVVIEQIRMRQSSAAPNNIGVGQATAAQELVGRDAATVMAPRDRRWGATTGVSRTVISRGGNAAGIIQELERIVSSSVNIDEFARCVPIVLPPGQALVVEHAVVNQNIAATFVGRERPALPGEL